MESIFIDYVKILCRSCPSGTGLMHLKHVKYTPNGGKHYPVSLKLSKNN